MTTRDLLGIVFLTLAAGLVLARPAAADYECRNICGADCDVECTYLGMPTTCFDWYHRSGDDGDNDGLAYYDDNCPCASNADQADCDTDGIGDVCDSRNEKWVFVQDLGRCDWDGDIHWNKIVVEQYGSHQYQNLCDNSYCYKRVLLASGECPFGVYDLSGCCEQNFGSSNCIHGSCGSPSCPF